ncbi:MAG: hypothetical protein ACLR78_04640 [Roseburia sp.]
MCVCQYNYAFLNQKLKELCGAEYTLDLTLPARHVTVKVGLAQKNQYDVVAEMLEEIVPCNLQLKLYCTISTWTSNHIQYIILAQFTHWELRNLSIPWNLKCCGRECSGGMQWMIWHASQWKRLRI